MLVGFLRVLTACNHLVVVRALAERWHAHASVAFRGTLSEEGAIVVDQYKCLEIWWTPDEFECDAGSELNMRHIFGWVGVAPHETRGPAAPGTELFDTCDFDAWTELIAHRYTADLAFIFVVRYVA